MAKCKECKVGELKVLGTGGYGATISVECEKCKVVYEGGQDSFGEEGLDLMLEAMQIDDRANDRMNFLMENEENK